jgi:RHS repeat-associated protein
LNIVNPHGDVFTTIPDVVNVTAAQVGACNDTDEFGVALTPSAPSYGWVGGKLRATNTATGLTLMGVRLYDPIIGRFLSTDSVYGGNDNTYTYPVDPVNKSDLDGNQCGYLRGGAKCRNTALVHYLRELDRCWKNYSQSGAWWGACSLWSQPVGLRPAIQNVCRATDLLRIAGSAPLKFLRKASVWMWMADASCWAASQ